MDGIKVPNGKGYEKRGGYARLSTLIKELRLKLNREIIIGVDAGDFFAGTIFSSIELEGRFVI